MAKKKETKKETSKKNNDYNFIESLKTFPVAEILKAGFVYYVNENNITINSDSQLETELNKFKNKEVGD